MIVYLLVLPFSAWPIKGLEDMVLIKKGCFMMGTNKIIDYLAFRSDVQERPNVQTSESSSAQTPERLHVWKSKRINV